MSIKFETKSPNLRVKSLQVNVNILMRLNWKENVINFTQNNLSKSKMKTTETITMNWNHRQRFYGFTR